VERVGRGDLEALREVPLQVRAVDGEEGLALLHLVAVGGVDLGDDTAVGGADRGLGRYDLSGRAERLGLALVEDQREDGGQGEHGDDAAEESESLGPGHDKTSWVCAVP